MSGQQISAFSDDIARRANALMDEAADEPPVHVSTRDEIRQQINEATEIKDLRVLCHFFADAIFSLMKAQSNLRVDFMRFRETSVPVVSKAQRRAGRFLRKGKHATKPHEWVVINDPQYVVFCDERSAALGLGFTQDEIDEAREAIGGRNADDDEEVQLLMDRDMGDSS